MNLRSGKSMTVYIAIVAFICFFMARGYIGKEAAKVAHYVNEEYGFKLTYPSSWTVADSKDAARREELARANAPDPSTAAMVDWEIFSAARTVGYSTRERLSIRASNLEPEEYLAGTLEFMRASMAPAEIGINELMERRVFDEREFIMLGLELPLPQVTVFQEIYVIGAEGGSIMFGLTAGADREMRELRRVFGTVKFE